MLTFRKRELNFNSCDPKELIGTKLSKPDMRAYFKVAHAKAGWGSEKNNETQARLHFEFDAGAFTRYNAEILGSDPHSIYFPLAYTGRLAKLLSDAGYVVHASDASDYWISYAKMQGIFLEKRSFEDFPEIHFDRVVMFEPYPIHANLVGFIGILKMLSSECPSTAMYYPRSYEVMPYWCDSGFSESNYDEALNNIPSYAMLAYHYGANFLQHFLMSEEPIRFETIIPTPESVKRAGIDLKVLDLLDTGIYSITLISKSLKLPKKEVAASLKRIKYLFELLFSSPFCHLQNQTYIDPQVAPNNIPVQEIIIVP